MGVGGKGEFKGRMKASVWRHNCTNDHAAMIIHPLLNYSGFVKHKKEIFSQKLHSFLDESCRKKKRSKS